MEERLDFAEAFVQEVRDLVCQPARAEAIDALRYFDRFILRLMDREDDMLRYRLTLMRTTVCQLIGLLGADKYEYGAYVYHALGCLDDDIKRAKEAE